MSDAAETTERHALMLGELAELGLALARDLQGRALGAADVGEAADAARAFHAVARTVRQSLALEARLRRELKRETREDGVHRAKADFSARERRGDQVRAAVTRLAWTEAEGDDVDDILEGLDEVLDNEALGEDFLRADTGVLVARIARRLGLDVPEPDPGPGDQSADDATEPDIPPPRGSA
jgi:hypothetical protein